jgi:hypothetical protein
MKIADALPFIVTMTLTRNEHVFSETLAEKVEDLYRIIEMDTGMGHLDAYGLYQRMIEENREMLSEPFNVCHSFVKWGAMQQEVVKIGVKLQRVI